MPTSTRPTLHEGGVPTSLSSIEDATGLGRSRIWHLLEQRSQRVRRELRLRDDPFTCDGTAVATSGVAGVMRLAPQCELEIVPKCFAPDRAEWREDFLVMATITRLGRVARRERVSASRRSHHSDLLSLLAAIFLDEFERLNRVPIREYHAFTWVDTDIDGELDYGALWEPRAEGFPQAGSRLTINNPFMHTIHEAAAYLGEASLERGVGERLRRLATVSRSPTRWRRGTRVPGRHSRWQELYDLSRDVLAGHGMHLAPGGSLRAPGFLLNTERCWEDLIALALATRSGRLGVEIKPRLTLGARYRGSAPTRAEDVSATPDILLDPPEFPGRIVVDAKYKGNSLNPIESIVRADLYEALGFMEAAASQVAILVHPGGHGGATGTETGAVTMFDRVVVGSRRVIGVTVNMRGIGRKDGTAEFGRRLGKDLLDIAAGQTV